MQKPQRMCASCKKRFEKDDLIRISKFEDRAVVDQNKEQKSRAIYVCKNIKCIDILKKSKTIERVLKVNSNDEFFEKLKLLVEEKDFE